MNPLSALRVVGWRSAYWYAVYRLERTGGIARRRTPVRSWESVLHGLPDACTAWDPESQPSFFFDDSAALRKALRRTAPRASDLLEKEILALRRGTFRLWETGRWECGFPPEWNRNPLTGGRRSTDRHWTEEEDRTGGDIKGIWELSRFGMAFRLARWHAFSGEARAAEIFWRLVESWLQANPPNAGPQWASAQEVALRAMAWVFAFRAFGRSPATTPGRSAKMIAALDAHARRIEATPAYARAQNNNHLISEAAGLFTVGLLFPSLPRAAVWRRKGRRMLAESASQFFPDGGYIQHSHNYHRLALQLLLWSMRLAELNGEPLPEELYRCVDRSADLLGRMADPETGRVPNFGHNDGALFLPLNSCPYEDYRPLLQTLSVWRGKGRRYPDGPWNEDAVWMVGPDAFRAAGRPLPEARNAARKPFAAERAGLYLLRGAESRAVIRCAEFRERPAHADQLHLDLWWRGENAAADAGSYLYSGKAPWRNSLVHAGVHNTVTVDGGDQMRHSGRFLWTSLAQGRAEFDGEGRWCGEHDGYRASGVVHRRSVERLSGDRWIIRDEILGAGYHTARLHWLIPDFRWKWIAPETESDFREFLEDRMPSWPQGSGAGLRLRTRAGGLSLRIWVGRTADWNLYRAGEQVYGRERLAGPVPVAIRGWRSLCYAGKIPALSLAGTAAGELPLVFLSLWAPVPRRP